MSSAKDTDPVVALETGLDELHRRVIGESGQYREWLLGISGKQGTLPDLIRSALEGLYTVMSWLHEAVRELAEIALVADAGIALFEWLGDASAAFGRELSRLGDDGGETIASLKAIGAAVETLGAAVGALTKLEPPEAVPDPTQIAAHLASILALTDALMGALDELETELAPSP